MTRLDEATRRAIGDRIRTAKRVAICGGGTKDSLANHSGDEADCRLEMTEFQGVVEYEPSEYTITVLAGTSVLHLQQTLQNEGQYLPSDPLWADQGATVGGTVASGVSGPRRLRYGGLRDFILGVRFWDGAGTEIRGGGKVVKNSAGFDLPKLFVGSFGRLGALFEVTLKVFPESTAVQTLAFEVESYADLLDSLKRLTKRPFELDALDYIPARDNAGHGILYARLAGEKEAFKGHQDKMVHLLGRLASRDEVTSKDPLYGDLMSVGDEGSEALLVKIPTTLDSLGQLLPWCEARGVSFQVSVAGQQLWLFWPKKEPLTELNRRLQSLDLSAVVVRGMKTDSGSKDFPVMGVIRGEKLGSHIKRTLDPESKFGD